MRLYYAGVSVERPSFRVQRAFGVGSEFRRLQGGQGTSWVSGDLVFKPGGAEVHGWLGRVLAGLRVDSVRVALPKAAGDGSWSVDGWTATSFVEGSHPDLSVPSTWVRIVAAGRSFHQAVAHMPRPDILDGGDDPWATADRVAWGERPMHFLPEFADLAGRLLNSQPPPGRPQLVHGDLTGNVLFAAGLPPALIDISPYWRPPLYAEAVVAADALCWHGADASVLGLVGVSAGAVARALLFRMATTNALATTRSDTVDVITEAHRYQRAAEAIGF
jgi:uncharacterized protein (TIGR02569 family)